MKHISIFDIIFAVYLRRKIFVAVILLFLLATIIYILITKPVYAPTAIVKANVYETVPTWVADLLQQRLVPSTPVDRMASQVELIKVLAGDVLKEDGANLEFKVPKKLIRVSGRKTVIDTIRKNLEFNVVFYPESILVYEKSNVLCHGLYDSLLNCNYFLVSFKKIGSFDKPIKGSITYRDCPLTIDSWLKSKVSVDQIGISDLVKISVEHDDPQYGVILANDIAQKYIDYSLEEEKRLAKETREKLEVLYKETERRVDSLKKIIQALKIDTLSLVSYILDFGLSNEPMARIVEQFFKNPGDKILEKVSRSYISKSLTLEEVASAYGTLVGQRNSLFDIIERTKLVEAKTVSVAQIIAYAGVPPKPNWPRKLLLILLSIFFGAFFGVLTVIVWERYDNRIYTPLKLKFLLRDNVDVFHSVDDLKLFLSINEIDKIYSNEKVDEISQVDINSAKVAVIVVRKGMHRNELSKIINATSNKDRIVLFKN